MPYCIIVLRDIFIADSIFIVASVHSPNTYKSKISVNIKVNSQRTKMLFQTSVFFPLNSVLSTGKKHMKVRSYTYMYKPVIYLNT
jgi:hypothetical protein